MQNQMKSVNSVMSWAVLTLTLVLGITNMLQAQISVGGRLGYNFNNVYTTNELTDVAPDFFNLDETSIGIVAEIPVRGDFSFQPELAYTTRGFGIKQGLGAELFGVELPLNARVETRIRTLEIPLLAKYKFGQGAMRGYVAAGPTVSYASSGRLDTHAKVIVEVGLGSTPIDLNAINYERWDIGATLGVGMQYDFNQFSMFADMRYYRGFNELVDIPLVEAGVRNKGFGLNIGVLVPVGG